MKREIGPNQMKIDAHSGACVAAAGHLVLDNIDYDERATMRAWENFLADEPKCARDPVMSPSAP